MKILLDIDGVMVTTPSWKRLELLSDNFSSFNNRAASSLQSIIDATNATIVLTTSHKSDYTILEWIAIFNKRGINITSIERLLANVNFLNRKDEIMNWIEQAKETMFVIIDDDKSLNDLPSHIKSKFILTDTMIGLDEEKSIAAIQVLKKHLT